MIANCMNPQEILQPNEEIEEEAPPKSDAKSGKSESDDEEDERPFKQIKMATKYSAFIKNDKLYYATKNTTIKGEMPF